MRFTQSRAWAKLAPAVLSLGLMLSMVCSLSAPAHAAGGIQGNLTGTVIDSTTSKPIANVHVTATSPSGSYSANTDGVGHFALLGLPADTYTVALSKDGYFPQSISGVAVFGDETDTVGVVRMSPGLKTVANVRSRSASSAFQPTQTQDVTTISGQRITQALGNTVNTNEQQLILAAPGAIVDSNNNITVRGSLNVELGYQFDGVNFTVPFFDGNGSSGYLSNITGGSGGSLQVVSGSGDATQGNIGAGVINIVPPRGTYPQTGQVSALIGNPWFNHQFDINYGFSTPNNRFSDYFSYDGSRFMTQYAPYGVDAATIGQYTSQGYTTHDDIVNNLVYRFGHQNDMSFQVLYRTSNQNGYGNYGGLNGVSFYPYNPLAASPWDLLFPGGINQYASTVLLLPGVPSTNTAPTANEELLFQPLSFVKLGYTWNLNPTTFLNLSYANFYQQTGNTNYYSGNPALLNQPTFVQVGGQRLAYELDATHQFGTNHTTTLAFRYEDDLPRWNQASPWFLMDTMGLGNLDFGTGSSRNPYAPSVDDFYLPTTPGLPVNPVSNPCQGIAGPDNNGCYVYDYLLANGEFNPAVGLPRIPTGGLDYHHAMFHEYGIGLRDQWTVNPRLHLDYGLRVDADNLDWGENIFGNGNDRFFNPSDVNVPTKLGNDFLRPRIWQPRFAASYQLGSHDSLRFSYGRSVNFFFAQTAGTPFDMSNIAPVFGIMPPKDSAAGIAYINAVGGTINPAAITPACGSGTNITQYPTTGGFWPCTNYAQSMFWSGDQGLDAPDLGGQGPPTYNNWDLAWSHEFAKGALNGFGLKLTGFARRGYNVEENTLLANGPPNPVTGQSNAAVFVTQANGVEKTYGAEFMLTAPDRPTGWGGFVTLNYISEFSSTPPVNTATSTGATNYVNDQLPIMNGAFFNSGELFRAGFLPPFQGRLAVDYKTSSGWKFNPIFSFDGGFPTGVGSQTYGAVNGQYLWIPSSNLGAAAPIGGPTGPGNPYNAPAFVDPAYPGSYLNPSYAATRGFDEPAIPGGTLTKAHGFLDFDVEYSPNGTPWTVGAYISNVFNNHYGLWYPNTSWQPVATGVGGPQTGQFASAYPGTPTYVAGARDLYTGNYSYYPFQVPYNPGVTYQFYLQRRL